MVCEYKILSFFISGVIKEWKEGECGKVKIYFSKRRRGKILLNYIKI